VLIGGPPLLTAGVEAEAERDEDPDPTGEAEDRGDLGVDAERQRPRDQRQPGEQEEADQPDPGAVDLHRYSPHSRAIRAATWAVASQRAARPSAPGSSASTLPSRAP